MDPDGFFGFIDFTGADKDSWLSPFYYSIVTYTTLGFGDIKPMHWVGELVVMLEVIMGYMILGLLLAILANKVARRAKESGEAVGKPPHPIQWMQSIHSHLR